MSQAILQVRDISLSFKGVKAINALSFEVQRGEICALIGPNGAGKSSLLNVLNGVYRFDAGEIVSQAESPGVDPQPELFAVGNIQVAVNGASVTQNLYGQVTGDFNGSYWTQTLTPSRRLESVPIAVISPQFLGEDAGTDYPYGVQNENEINAIQLRLVAEVTR